METNGVFEGGGVKGIALIGALKRIEEEGVILKRVAGTSAGAIVAALYAAGYSADELKEILWNTDFTQFANIRKVFKEEWYKIHRIFLRFFALFFPGKGYGIFSTRNFYLWMKKLLDKKEVTNFKSLSVYIRIFAVDIVNQKLLQFDRDVTPDLEVADAVRMSMCIPLFFKAKVRKEAFIVDGGLLANYPIATFGDREELKSTIGFKLVSKEDMLPPRIPGNIFSYIMRIFETMQVAHERIFVEEAKWARTIPIPTGNISIIKFDLTDTEKSFLWNSGYNAADKAIKEGLLSEEGRQT